MTIDRDRRLAGATGGAAPAGAARGGCGQPGWPVRPRLGLGTAVLWLSLLVLLPLAPSWCVPPATGGAGSGDSMTAPGRWRRCA